MTMYPTYPDMPPDPPPVPDGRIPDPGSSRAAMFAWIAAGVLMLALVVLNQFFGEEAPAKAPAASKAIEPPDAGDPFTITAKLFVKLSQSWGLDPAGKGQFVQSLQPQAKTDEDRVRMAIVAGDMIGPKAAVEDLDKLTVQSETLQGDIERLKRIYEPRVSDPNAAPPPDPDEVKLLVDHHGWFGKLAASNGLANSDPTRAPLLEGAGWLVFAGIMAFIVILIAFFGGITAFIVMIVQISSGKLRRRFVPPAPGGSVFLETVPVFIASFLLLKLVIGLVVGAATGSGTPPAWVLHFQLLAQWALVIVPFYPVIIRRMPFSDFRRSIGWHSGEGVFKEIGAGILGYFAGLPLLFAVMMVSVVIVVIRSFLYKALHNGEEAPLPHNAIGELLGKGSPLTIALLFLLATMWAPLVEEAVFRGSLYRHLRSRMGMLGAAIISGLVFGCMHGYAFFLLGPVIAIGFIFALMREWRGSLIPTMTAHFLHNATVLAMVLMVLQALKD